MVSNNFTVGKKLNSVSKCGSKNGSIQGEKRRKNLECMIQLKS